MESRAGYKDCPRCGLRNRTSAASCDFCGYAFEDATDEWNDYLDILAKLGKESDLASEDEEFTAIASTIVRPAEVMEETDDGPDEDDDLPDEEASPEPPVQDDVVGRPEEDGNPSDDEGIPGSEGGTTSEDVVEDAVGTPPLEEAVEDPPAEDDHIRDDPEDDIGDLEIEEPFLDVPGPVVERAVEEEVPAVETDIDEETTELPVEGPAEEPLVEEAPVPTEDQELPVEGPAPVGQMVHGTTVPSEEAPIETDSEQSDSGPLLERGSALTFGMLASGAAVYSGTIAAAVLFPFNLILEWGAVVMGGMLLAFGIGRIYDMMAHGPTASMGWGEGSDGEEGEEVILCPVCYEEVSAEDEVCPKCGAEFSSD